MIMKHLVYFWLILCSFSFYGCSSPKWFWCTSNGIMTYNKTTGQFEMIWENTAKQLEIVHDTVYVEKQEHE